MFFSHWFIVVLIGVQYILGLGYMYTGRHLAIAPNDISRKYRRVDEFDGLIEW